VAVRREDIPEGACRRLYESGLSLAQVGEAVGLTPEGVKYRLEQEGCKKMRGRGRPCKKLCADTVVDLWSDGYTAQQIAELFEVQTSSVYYHLRRRGVALPGNQPRVDTTPERIREYRALGFTMQQIANIVGCARFSLYRILNEETA
jgi:AraC-like DNA-binding protein